MSDELGRGEVGRGDAWLDGIVVPDDISELHEDVAAYHRERRLAARRRRFARISNSRAWQRFAVPVAVVGGSLAIAGSVLGILTFEHPQRLAGPQPAPIATSATAAVGELNGLVPDVDLRTTSGAVSIRTLRPALVALVPAHCNCSTVLGTLAAQADEVAIPLVAVAAGSGDAELDSLPGRLHRGEVVPAFDLHGVLASTYAASGITVLALRPDATVSYVQRDVDGTVRLEPVLEQLVMPAASLHSA